MESKLLYNDKYVQSLASAIREKSGFSSTYKISQMANAIENLPEGEDVTNYKKILDRTISGSFSDSKLTEIKTRAF